MFYTLIATLLVAAAFTIAASSVFVKLFAASIFAAAAYGLFRQFQPAPAALADAENTVTGAAQNAYQGVRSVEQTIEQAVRSHLPSSAPVAPVPPAPVVPASPVAPAAPSTTDTPKV